MTLEMLKDFVIEQGNDIYGFCYYLTGEKEKADELYQQTFLKATEIHNKIRENGNIKSYIMGISARLWKNYQSKATNHQRILTYYDFKNTITDNGSPEGNLIAKEYRLLVLQCVHMLSLKLKLPMVMYYYGDMSIEEISKKLIIPKGTVKSRLYKGRKLLKKYLEEKGYGKEDIRSDIVSEL